jgi:hypothetical protein
MRSAAVGIILAVVLFAAGAVCWREARVTREMVDAHERLATLHYDAEDGIEDGMSVTSRLPRSLRWSEDDVERHRATVAYWRSQFSSLTETAAATGSAAVSDPDLLLVAANAQFRSSSPEDLDRKAAVGRLDTVIGSYAEVLRKDPSLADAAYNYEFVVRLREALAKLPARGNARDARAKKPVKPEIVSVDLPTGPTVQGRPGGPPEESDMGQFKTISPMRYDEREQLMEPGRGSVFRRKG